jgi:hypothetical protein
MTALGNSRSTRRLTEGSQDGRVYVIDNLRHLADVKVDDKSWWCVEHSTKVGAHSAVYLKGKGIKLLFRTVGAAVARDTFCEGYGMVAVPIQIIAVFEQPLTFRALRVHPVLNSLPGLRRNFQGTSFHLPRNLFAEMLGQQERTELGRAINDKR